MSGHPGRDLGNPSSVFRIRGVVVRSLAFVTLLLCIIGFGRMLRMDPGFAGQPAIGRLAGRAGVAIQRASTAGHSEHLGLHPGRGREMSGPVLVMPTTRRAVSISLLPDRTESLRRGSGEATGRARQQYLREWARALLHQSADDATCSEERQSLWVLNQGNRVMIPHHVQKIPVRSQRMVGIRSNSLARRFLALKVS